MREKLVEEGNGLTLQNQISHGAVIQRSKEMNYAAAISRMGCKGVSDIHQTNIPKLGLDTAKQVLPKPNKGKSRHTKNVGEVVARSSLGEGTVNLRIQLWLSMYHYCAIGAPLNRLICRWKGRGVPTTNFLINTGSDCNVISQERMNILKIESSK